WQCGHGGNLKGAMGGGQDAPAEKVLDRVLVRYLDDRDEIILSERRVQIDDAIPGAGEKDLGVLIDGPRLLDAHRSFPGKLQQNNCTCHGTLHLLSRVLLYFPNSDPIFRQWSRITAGRSQSHCSVQLRELA